MAGPHNLLFLTGLLLAIVCLAHSQSRRFIKRNPSVYRTRVTENEGGEADDIGSVVDSMQKAILLLEHRIMNLETNGQNLYNRLETIEAKFSPSADEEAGSGEITEQPHVTGSSNTSNDLPSGIKSHVPLSSSNASHGANEDSEENNIDEQNSDKDKNDTIQGEVVALLEDAEAAIAEAADIINNQNNPQKPESDAGKDNKSTVNVDGEGTSNSSEEVDDQPAKVDADFAPHTENHTSTDKTPHQHYVMVGSDEKEQPTTGDVEVHNGNPTSVEVIPDQNDVLGGESDEEEQPKTESPDVVDKRYGVDTQRQQTRPQNRSFRFHRRLLPYNRRVSIHRGI